MDKFPEAFERFERTHNTKDIKSFDELRMAFDSWAGDRWRDSPRQLRALAHEARRLGIPVPVSLRRRRVAERGGYGVEAEGRFSVEFSSYDVWSEKPSRSSAYQRRIEGYMKRHSNASLREARGHKHRG